MKVLLSWLREFVDVPGKPEDVAQTMSVRGFAVEGIEKLDTGDSVLDFEVTANRPDCMSVIGMAREVATAYGLQVRSHTVRSAVDRDNHAALALRSLKSASGADISVHIDDPKLCPRYAGAVADVSVRPSPAWMQARLAASGVRPISSIVDITNYVLLELGQPMHAFDLSTIAGAEIRVRTARPGEPLKTLDGQTRELTADMLVIADAQRACAVAGVMGGAESEVTETTKAIVFESACFNPLSVRRTSRKLGLKTEASMRFERGTDPSLPLTAMERACALLEAIDAGRSRGTVVDCHPLRVEPAVLALRRGRIARLLGMSVPDADTVRILESLGFALRETSDGWNVTVPTRRVDVVREVDLIEEIARHYGFDHLPATFPPLISAAPTSDPRIARARQLRGVLTGIGFSEAMTFGFVAEDAAAPFSSAGDLVHIANPLSESFGVLRPSSLPGIIDAVAHNRRREQRDVRLFEIGATFSRSTGERRTVACAWTGAAVQDHWSGGARDVDFFDMKGVVERVCDALQVEMTTEPHAEEWLTPGQTAVVNSGGTRIGTIGLLAPVIAEHHGLAPVDAVYVAELDLDAVEQLAPKRERQVEPLPRYPSVIRDISILIAETLAAAAVRDTIRQAGPAALVRVSEFDRYQGKGVPEGKVSLSLRLTFRSPDRTLTDTEVQAAMDKILAALAAEHGATQR